VRAQLLIRSNARTVARVFAASEATGRAVDTIIEAALREYLPRLEGDRPSDPAVVSQALREDDRVPV
jgi:hypothetical protein